MRSILSTTAILTIMLSGAALQPQAARADGYYAPRASAAEINHVINAGSTGHYAPRYGGGYGSSGGYGHRAGYVSRGYGHADYGYGHGYSDHGYGDHGYGHVDYGYDRDDYGYGRDLTDLDDFGTVNRDGRLITTYRTYSPFARVIHSAAPVDEMDGMASDMEKPEPRSDVGRPILFASGSDDLSETATADLDRIGNILLAYAETDVRILISAYTDATGTREQNEAISKKRIETVKSYLADKFDIPVERFVEAPIGEATAPGIDDPLAAENRQVVISLLGLDLDKAGDRVADRDAVEAEPTCSVPAYPYAGYRVEGRVVAAGFQDLDDFGGGRLIEVCKVGH